MDTIGRQKIWSFFDKRRGIRIANNVDIRKGAGHKVGSYFELATKIADLQYRNRDHVLLFRGQGGDYRNVQGNASLKPSLFRPNLKSSLDPATLNQRFSVLHRAERALIEHFNKSGFIGIERLRRNQVLRWAILQHYEVCPTPLLDVTHSVRMAASFASLAKSDLVYLYVLGVPNLGSAITTSLEAGLLIVRLSSVCPPSAVRPHIQEGYLLGTFPEVAGHAQYADLGGYFHYEVDFGLRLVAKFCFEPRSFWKSRDFPKVAKSALYPSEKDDPLYKLALDVQKGLGQA